MEHAEHEMLVISTKEPNIVPKDTNYDYVRIYDRIGKHIGWVKVFKADKNSESKK